MMTLLHEAPAPAPAPEPVLVDHAHAVLTFHAAEGLVLRCDFRGAHNEALRDLVKAPAQFEGDGSLRTDRQDRPLGFGMRFYMRDKFWYVPGSNKVGSLTSRLETIAQGLCEVLVAHGITVHVNLGDGPNVYEREAPAPPEPEGRAAKVAQPVDLSNLGEVIEGGGAGQANPGWVGSLYAETARLPQSAINTMIRQDIGQAKRTGQLPADLAVSVRMNGRAVYIDVSSGPRLTGDSPEAETLTAITQRYNRWSPYDVQYDVHCSPRFYAYITYLGAHI